MKRLKECKNLYCLYSRSMNKVRIPFFVSLGIFVLGFATMFIESFPFGLTLGMLGMIFLVLLFGILWIVFSARTKKYLKAFSDQQLRRINEEVSSVAECGGLRVTSQAIVHAKAGLEMAPLANVLWVYTDVLVVKLEGLIPLQKITTLIIAGRDKKKYSFRIKNNQKIFPFLQSELLKHRQDIVFGNEDGLEEIYKKDINRMIAFSQECAQKRQKN